MKFMVLKHRKSLEYLDVYGPCININIFITVFVEKFILKILKHISSVSFKVVAYDENVK